MGTTCTAILVRQNQLYLAHVGDSRAYLFRDGLLNQISDDQTLHAQLIRDGVMTAEEAAHSPGGNFILQALGAREAIAPTIYATGLPLLAGDRLMLCSDGLHGMVRNEDISTILATRIPSEACHLLIAAANAAGGHDNISVGVFDVDESKKPDRAAPAATRQIIAEAGLPPEMERPVDSRNDP
jgi:protein phosphatase